MNAAVATAPMQARFPSVLIDRIVLADGRSVIVRPVVAIDAPAEQAFVRALSIDARRKRFHTAVQELPPALLRHLTDVDHVGHVAIVAESLADGDDEDDTATIVADARYVRDGDETQLAIAVADAWQGVGLGRALLQRLLRHAARHGIECVVADMLPGNAAILRLALSCGGRLGASPLEPGLRRAWFHLTPPQRGPRHTARTDLVPCFGAIHLPAIRPASTPDHVEPVP